MTFARRVFLIAGIYGLIALLPQYFLESRIGQDDPPAITHPEFFYGFTGVAIAWQVAFLIISRDPMRYRLLMIPSILEKLSFGIAVIILFMLQRASATVLGFASIDLVLGALFLVAFFKCKAPSTNQP